jgi:hypothetical protein
MNQIIKSTVKPLVNAHKRFYTIGDKPICTCGQKAKWDNINDIITSGMAYGTCITLCYFMFKKW